MIVETYEVEEIKGELGVMAADAEALELIEKLGLTGQKSLSNPETVTRMPYRVMTMLERNVCDVLFPKRVKLENYADGPIPLRVLQVAALCKEQGFFKKLEVWCPETRQEKDPVLVGWALDPVHPEWTWNDVAFLLARWGDALPTWEVLAEKARKIWLARTAPKLQALRAKIETDLASLDTIAAQGFSGGELKALDYSLNSLV